MGNDGGSIPKRHELVKTVKAAKKADKEDALMAKWLHCSLSKEVLVEPIMADDLGQLYNKEEVIRYLLEKKSIKNFEHIKKMKDLTELRLKTAEKKAESKLGAAADVYKGDISKFVCPITSIPMNGKYKFSFSKTCGCVFSEKALKEVPSPTCLLCGKEFTSEDVIPIYGDESEVQKLRQKMEEKLEKEKAAKAEKSEKSEKAEKAEKADKADKADKKQKKRKLEEEEAELAQESEKKSHLEGKSDVYKSLFKPANEPPKGKPRINYLNMGTFTYYAGQ